MVAPKVLSNRKSAQSRAAWPGLGYENTGHPLVTELGGPDGLGGPAVAYRIAAIPEK